MVSTIQRCLIRIQGNAPLRFLNLAFPNGIPVTPDSLISINGIDCYHFSPEKLPSDITMRHLGRVIAKEEILAYAFIAYKVVAIPCEWCEVYTPR